MSAHAVVETAEPRPRRGVSAPAGAGGPVRATIAAVALVLLVCSACAPPGTVTVEPSPTSGPSPTESGSATAGPSPSTTEAVTPTTEAPPTTSAPPPEPPSACLPGITLPEGADPRACGAAPADATPLNLRGFGYYAFVMPSGIAGREIVDGILSCRYLESTWTSRDPNSGAPCVGYAISDGATTPHCPSDVALWMASEADTPGYGQAVTASSFACLIEESGVTCWSTVSGHGMKLSRSTNLTW